VIRPDSQRDASEPCPSLRKALREEAGSLDHGDGKEHRLTVRIFDRAFGRVAETFSYGKIAVQSRARVSKLSLRRF
jgi:hypothetical protein